MDGVGISIIGRPRPLPGHDTPNPAHNTYTLNYEELPKPTQNDYITPQDLPISRSWIIQSASEHSWLT